MFPFYIFRAYDIRGKTSVLTPELVQAIAYGLVDQYQQAGQSELVIGYDARLSSPFYAQIIARVCRSQGLKVTELGCCSSPLMYYVARQHGGNGVMVTASHNPKLDNGIKWILQGEPPDPDQIQQVAKAAADDYHPEQPVVRLQPEYEFKSEFCRQYQQTLSEDIDLKRRFKVVLDGLHGSAGHCAQRVLSHLGCDVVALRCEANGEFPDHAPDPSQASHLNKLRQQVLQHQADVGIALDGDGDRLVLVDEQAHIISADRLLAFFAKICLEKQPQHEIVFDVKCSSMVRETVHKFGGQACMIRTGSSFLRKYLLHSQRQAVFGGEYAGHYVFNDGRGFGYDDGLYAALRALEYLSQFPGSSLSQLLQDYPERCATQDIYISTHGMDPKRVLQDVEISSQRLEAQLSKIDGVRLDFDGGFGIIRASNTGEYFTVRFDADSPAKLGEIQHQFVSMLRDRYPKIAQDILDAQ